MAGDEQAFAVSIGVARSLCSLLSPQSSPTRSFGSGEQARFSHATQTHQTDMDNTCRPWKGASRRTCDPVRARLRQALLVLAGSPSSPHLHKHATSYNENRQPGIRSLCNCVASSNFTSRDCLPSAAVNHASILPVLRSENFAVPALLSLITAVSSK